MHDTCLNGCHTCHVEAKKSGKKCRKGKKKAGSGKTSGLIPYYIYKQTQKNNEHKG